MHISTRISLFSLALILCSTCLAGAQDYLEGDLNGDHKVDFADLQTLTNYWLNVNCLAPDCNADIDGMPGVNMYDFARLATNWRKDDSETTLTININGNGSVNKEPDKATYHYGEDVNLTANPATGWPLVPPKDDFNDSGRSATWRLVEDDPVKTWLVEDANVLNIRASGWANLSSSCVGHWMMNDEAATPVVLDDSGKDHNGTARQNTSALHTTGKINGALSFNGSSDYVNLGNVIPRAAYTKVAWVNRNDVSTAYNNIVSSGDATSHALYAPYNRQFRLCAGHTGAYYDTVKDTQPLAAGVWYFVAVTYDPNVSSGKMVLYKNGVEVNEASNVPLPGAGSTQTCIGKFSTNYYMNGAIDNVMIFNRALTADEIAALYNKSNGTETIPSGSSSVVGTHQATYLPNGWSLDVDRDLAVKVDYHYGQTSAAEGWAGLSVGDDSNYVSISAGSDANASYFYYEAVVDGSSASEKLPRTSNDGTLYITYDATDRKFYLSHTGFGSEYADVWQTTNPTQGLWAMPLDVSMGGGSSGACLYSGEAFLDNFEMNSAGLFDWPPKNDVVIDGFIDYYDLEIICENWLDSGQGDLDNSGTVDFGDLAKMGLAW